MFRKFLLQRRAFLPCLPCKCVALLWFVLYCGDRAEAQLLLGNANCYTANNIAIDQNTGKRFVLTASNVQVFDAQGNLLQKLGDGGNSPLLNRARGIALDGFGRIYVADTYNHRVLVFNSDGSFQRSFGSFGIGVPGSFYFPHGIAVDSWGNIYIADTFNNRIQILTNNGQFIASFGTGGTAAGQFNLPVAITLDNTGNIYVADWDNSRVQKFNSARVFQLSFGSNGTADGQFRQVGGVAVDGSGNVYISDYGNRRVQYFDAAGTFLGKFGASGSLSGQFLAPIGVQWDAGGGKIYVADASNHNVQMFSPTGGFLGKIGMQGTGSGQFHDPTDVLMHPNGRVYVGDKYNHRIQVFSSSGSFIFQFGGFGIGDGQFNQPLSMALDVEGNIYVCDHLNNRVQVFDADGNYLTKFGVGELQQPFGIAINDAGKIFVSELTQHRIHTFDAEGVSTGTIGTFGTSDGQLRFPCGLSVNDDGDIFVADRENNRVQIFAADGAFRRKINVVGASMASAPTDVAIDSKGRIYICDSGNNSIAAFDSNFAFLRYIGSGGDQPGSFISPDFVSTSGTKLYVSDISRVQEIQGTRDPRIVFELVPFAKYGDAPIHLIATSDSEARIHFQSGNSSVVSVLNETATIIKPGTTEITVLQEGDVEFAPASLTRSLVVQKAEQTITLSGSISTKTYGDPSFDISAIASSGLVPSVISSNPQVATISGQTVEIVGAGSSLISVIQEGNEYYNAAPAISQSLLVNKADQTITFPAIPELKPSDMSYRLNAVTSSGVSVSYRSSNEGVVIIQGSNAIITGYGSTIITASAAEDASHKPAESTQVLTVKRLPQAIAFPELPLQNLGDGPITLMATASSLMPVRYTLSNEHVAKLTGNMVTVLGAGEVIVTAYQDGDLNYEAAPPTTQILRVRDLIEISPSLSLGQTIIGSSSDEFFVIKNTGIRPLEIVSVSYPAGFSGTKDHFVVESGTSFAVPVKFSPEEQGVYQGRVVITDATGVVRRVELTGEGLLVTHIDEMHELPTSVFPNPSTGLFFVRLDADDVVKRVCVVDRNGKQVAAGVERINDAEISVDVTGQQAGVYFIEVVTANRGSVRRKLVKVD
jgi:sugar lactone lactonase YvrE